MKEIVKIISIILCYIILFVFLLLYSLNFNFSYIIDGGDTLAYLNPFIFLEKGKYIWEDSVLGRINILALIQIIYSVPLAVLYYIFQPNVAQFVYWVILFSLIPISFYLLSYYLTRNSVISFYGGILYSLNLYTAIIHHTPVYHMLYLHGVTPLLVLVLLKIYENDKMFNKYIIFFTILYLPLLRMHNMYIIYFFIIPLISIIILKFYKKLNLNFNKFFKKSFIIYTLIVVLSLPYFTVLTVSYLSQSAQVNPNVEFSEKSVKVSKIHANLLNIMRFISTYGWEKVWDEIPGLQGFSAARIYHTNPLLILLTFYPILLTLMLSLAIMSKSDKHKIVFISYLLGLALIFLFLAKMINPPFGQINEFLYNHSTVFLILFRSAWKYMQIPYILTVCLIISIGLKELHTKYIKENKKFILLIVILFLIHIAYISPAIITHSKLINKAWIVKVPKEYYEVAEFFNNQKEDFRVLPLPLSKHWTGYVPYTWGYAGPDVLYTLLKKPMIDKYHNPVLPSYEIELISKIEKIPPDKIYKLNNYSKIFNIKYILIRNDVDMNHKYIKLWYSPEQYLKYVKKELPIKKIYKFGNLIVFELKNYGKRIYILNNSREKLAKIISYEKINPTLWKVKVNATKPFMLSFAEAYDPLWEARIYKDGKLVERVRSIPLYSVINGFWINETGELEIVIRYTPQDWFELGLKISGLTFIGCIFYLFYDWRREKGDRWAKRLEGKVKDLLRTLRQR